MYDFLDVREAAECMRMSTSWLYKKIAARSRGEKVDIPEYTRLSNRVFFRKMDILNFLASKVER